MTVQNLLSLNVNEHTEKKNNLTYLSWAWAWAEALKADAAATFKVELFDGKCYMDVNGTGMVWVTVTMFNKPMTCMLPVMDYRNKPIPNPDAFAVNTAIMRCMTKALALHGLGLYIYSGEDLPQKPAKENEQDAGSYAETGHMKHTPRGGIGDDLPQDVKDYLLDMANATEELVQAGKAVQALEMINAAALEADQRVWLASQMSASTRGALKKAQIKPTES
tara:strand:+ start:1645 stop:2307 length:663 start_codon:yes stop_codon:yes gene_type:complete